MALRGCLLLLLGIHAACSDEDEDGAFPGANDLEIVVATRGPDALELLDAESLRDVLDTPEPLPAPPVEARAEREREIFVTAFEEEDGSRAYDSRLFQPVPASGMEAGGYVAFDRANGRIYLAARQLAFFDARDFSPLGFPPIDLGGEASDVVHDPETGRIFVAVTGVDGPVLRVFGAADLAEVQPGPVPLPGGPGTGTGDLLLVGDRRELFVLLPEASRLVALDPSTLRQLPRSPIELRVPAASLALDPERGRLYAAARDGRLDSVGATDFSLTGDFPRQVAESLVDLAYETETDRLFGADSAARRLIVLDAVTLRDEPRSPIRLEGSPVSVEPLDLRPR